MNSRPSSSRRQPGRARRRRPAPRQPREPAGSATYFGRIECAGVTLTLDQQVANFNNADLTGGNFEGFKLERSSGGGHLRGARRDATAGAASAALPTCGDGTVGVPQDSPYYVERGLVDTLDRYFYCRTRGLDELRLRPRLYVGREKVGGRVMVDRAPRATPRPLPLGALTPVAFRPSMRTMTPPAAGTLSESRAP